MTKNQIIKHRHLLQGSLNPISLALFSFAALLLVGCDQQKAAIDAKADATINALDDRKEAVKEEAADATKRTDLGATIEKAEIEAQKVAAQAQIEADKVKADADATAAKARVDAVKNL